jgi:UDP-N-acetylmuramoyl-L-alanyl-D-glutamate--2,6-diaminopimelate ligase
MTARAIRLSDLGLTARAGRDPALSGLTADSRAVRAGMLFAALPGTATHGARFIPAALEQGAVAILTDAEGARLAAAELTDGDAALVVAEDPRAALACAAALWFGAQPETMVAVTGTNGKTSAATFTRQIWAALGHEAINIGTTGIEGAWTAPSSHTTPDAVALQKLLATAAQAGVTHAAMEASSHGIDQRRLDGVRLAAAGFTNLTQDHLDYHGTMEAYFVAKAQLFTRLLPDDGVAVVNLDGAKGSRMAELALARGLRVLTVGKGQGADLQIAATRPDATGQEVRYLWQGRAFQTRLNLIGAFQAENVAVAAGLAIAARSAPIDGGPGPDAAGRDQAERSGGLCGLRAYSRRDRDGAAGAASACHGSDHHRLRRGWRQGPDQASPDGCGGQGPCGCAVCDR